MLAASLAIALSIAAQASAPKFSFGPAIPRTGELALVYVECSDPRVQRGVLHAFGYEFMFFRVTDSAVRAAIAIPMEVEPGPYPIDVQLGNEVVHLTMSIAAHPWDSSQLHVAQEFTKKKSRALIDRLRAEEKSWNALWIPEPTAPRFVGTLSRPVKGEVTGLFGTRRVFNGRVASVHYGLDLDGRIGDEIRGAQAGRVVLSEMRWASGGTIILDHGGGVFTAYFHMSVRGKKVGDMVRAGELLGLVGKTGRVTGPHLHFQVMIRARKLDAAGAVAGPPRNLQVDPQPVLGLRFEGEPRFLAATTSSIAANNDEGFGGAKRQR